jgi:hypothetical protein
MPLALGAVKQHVRAAAEEIAMRFQISSISGYRPTGSVANSDHPGPGDGSAPVDAASNGESGITDAGCLKALLDMLKGG